MARARRPQSPPTRTAAATAAVAALGMALSACAGSAGSAGSSDDAGDGYEYGAAQEEVDAVIADLDPVTIDYQIPATSMESPQAPMGTT
ncbi:MAG TPA: C4-dicarboxylate ABC transporter substrate-binding protein, partial [Brevibacterium sp.]|nr:C4-dicarboxylate ABC transporter substrate-binding protein [Brevibacterium sp.]